MKLTDQIRINASMDRVFEFVTNPQKQRMWMDGLVDTEYTDQKDGRGLVGSTFKQHLIKGHQRIAYVFQGEVVAFERPRQYAVTLSSADFDATIGYRLEGSGEETLLTRTTEMEVHGGFVARFLGKMAAHHGKQDLKKLVLLLESEGDGLGS
jgi:carbon monoxide dehydrogenase subunit G